MSITHVHTRFIGFSKHYCKHVFDIYYNMSTHLVQSAVQQNLDGMYTELQCFTVYVKVCIILLNAMNENVNCVRTLLNLNTCTV